MKFGYYKSFRVKRSVKTYLYLKDYFDFNKYRLIAM